MLTSSPGLKTSLAIFCEYSYLIYEYMTLIYFIFAETDSPCMKQGAHPDHPLSHVSGEF